MEQHSGALVRYAAALTGDLDRARDIVQDVFIRLCGARPQEVEAHLAEWLFTVCRRRVIDVLRKENRMQPLTENELEHQPESGPAPDLAAEHRDLHARVLQVLAGLPPNQQEVVRLKFQNGLSYDEISRVTALSVSNVGFLIHTAIKALRQRLQTEIQ